MKKFFGCITLFLVATNLQSMENRPDPGEKEYAEAFRRHMMLKNLGEAYQRIINKRSQLLPKERKALNDALTKTIIGRIDITRTQSQRRAERKAKIKTLLEQGADPDGDFNDRPLANAALLDQDETVTLLLTYGADPNLGSNSGAPITCAAHRHIMEPLVHAGARINAIRTFFEGGRAHLGSALACACAYPFGNNLDTVVFALDHGADPNLPRGHALHAAVDSGNLGKVIALVQKKAHIAPDVLLLAYQTPMTGEFQTIFEFIKAFDRYHFDPHHAYTATEYKTWGISPENADKIRTATLTVNNMFDECALDDFRYDHGKLNITKYMLDRAVGNTGKRKR